MNGFKMLEEFDNVLKIILKYHELCLTTFATESSYGLKDLQLFMQKRLQKFMMHFGNENNFLIDGRKRFFNGFHFYKICQLVE